MSIRLLNFIFLLTLWSTIPIAQADPEQTVDTSATPVTIKTITPVKFEDSKLAHLVAEQTAKKSGAKSQELDSMEPEKNSGHDDAAGARNIPDPEVVHVKTVGEQTEIEICSSLPLTGEDGQLGKQINDGMNLFFNKLKKDKSIKRLVKLFVLDDQSNFNQSKTNLTELMHHSP